MKYLSEKQQKRLTRLKKRMCRMILLFLLIDLALAAVFWNEFYIYIDDQLHFLLDHIHPKGLN